MARNGPTPVPSHWLWLIRAASWIVPAPSRRVWREARLTEIRQWWSFLVDRGPVTPSDRREVRRFCWDSFRCALEDRFPGAGLRASLRRSARGPGFALLALITLSAGILVVSGFVEGIRTVYAPLPFPSASRLVACFQVHFLSVSLGAQSRYFLPWRQRSQTLEGLAAYRLRNYTLQEPGGPPLRISGADVTASFFPLLGIDPVAGRAFGATPAAGTNEPSVLVSHRFWRTRLGSRSDLERLSLALDGAPHRVAGVLPENFWFRSRQLDVWTLLPDPRPGATSPQILGMVGRLRPGATPEQAKSELERIAFSTPGIRGGPVRVVPLEDYFRPALNSIVTMMFAAWFLALGIAAVQYFRAVWKAGSPRREALRYWSFFGLKPVLLVASLALAAAEMAARNVLSLRSGKFLVNLLLEWLVVLGVLLIFRWAVLDQARRCPVCLRRLAMPASVGMWSSMLIEPAATELLCDQGHGALTVSESGGVMGELRRWITLEDAWRAVARTGRK